MRCTPRRRLRESRSRSARLRRIDPCRVQVVEMRFFGGLSVDETASVLQVSPQTVMRDWRLARAWLARELRAG